MLVQPAGDFLPQAAADAVLVMGTPAATQDVVADVRAASPDARVVVAGDRRTFVQSLQSGSWSLVVVSFDSPDYSGRTALRDARNLSSAPVIATGVSPSPGEVAAALRDGADDFIALSPAEVRSARVGRFVGRGATMRPQSGARHDCFSRRWEGLDDDRAIVLLDRDWNVVDCSPRLGEVLGYEPADLVGAAFTSLFVSHAEAAEFLGRLNGSTAGVPYSDSAWMLRRDGLRMWAEVTCAAGTRGESPCFSVTLRDATLQYRVTQSVRKQADAAVAATAGRNLFLGSIAHELRGALAPIATSAVALQRVALEPARKERLVEIIHRNATSAARLVEDLLTFSTASENKLRLRNESVDLFRLVTECTDAAQQNAAAAKVALQVELASAQAETRVQGDAGRIRQVVVNLISNAIKFTPDGGTVRVRISGEADGACIEVTDNGVGIDPEVLPTIFDPFEQGATETNARFGGFGLGLAICAAIAKLHGGNISATSPGRGQGASFRVFLPRHGSASGSRERHAGEPVMLHVLYVEDNPDAADAMKYALGKLGWTMTHAASCASARALVGGAGHAFDVVLADLGLPDGSGLDLGRELCRQLPVVALSAYGAPLGMAGFASQLIKPAEIMEVQRALLRAVAVHREAVLR